MRRLAILLHDVRDAARGLRRHPSVTITVVALLGVGVGVSTVAFSVVYGLVGRSLPYAGADRLVRIGVPGDGSPGVGSLFKQPFAALEESAESFAQVAAYVPRTLAWVGPEGPEALQGASVSPSLFPLLRATLQLGRSFAEAGNGAHRVALLSYDTWLGRFGGDPATVGAVLELGGLSYTVAGVLSEGIDFPGPKTEFWIPIVLWSSDPGLNRVAVPVSVLGRLKRGVSAEQAQAEARAIVQQRFGDRFTSPSRPLRVMTLRDALVGAYRPALWVLTTAAGVLLMLVGASVTGLLLVRLSSRQRELAVRGMLGATLGRIVRGLLVESVVLSLAGGAVGLVAAAVLQRLVRALIPGAVAPLVASYGDGAVLAFTLGVSVGVGLLFGSVPALHALGGRLFRSLQEASQPEIGGLGLLGGNRARAALVVAQVAAALVLLVAAGLLMHSFVRLVAGDPGHDPRNVLTLRVGSPDLPDVFLDGTTAEQGGERFASKLRFYEALVQELRQLEELPGMEAVGLSSTLPLAGQARFASFQVVGHAAPRDPWDLPLAQVTLVSPGYFEALRPHVRAGRLFSRLDTMSSPRVAVVNETWLS